jgi:hypothetical protein
MILPDSFQKDSHFVIPKFHELGAATSPFFSTSIASGSVFCRQWKLQPICSIICVLDCLCNSQISMTFPYLFGFQRFQLA